MNEPKELDTTEAKKGRFSRLVSFFTFRNTVIVLGIAVVLLIFVQIVLFRNQPTPLEENNIESITADLQEQINTTQEEIVVITDTRIVSYDEYLKIVESLKTESKTVIPSGKLLKQWMSSDAESLFGQETTEELVEEEFGGIPYEDEGAL
jgi:low affinity Fe/Cu permease